MNGGAARREAARPTNVSVSRNGPRTRAKPTARWSLKTSMPSEIGGGAHGDTRSRWVADADLPEAEPSAAIRVRFATPTGIKLHDGIRVAAAAACRFLPFLLCRIGMASAARFDYHRAASRNSLSAEVEIRFRRNAKHCPARRNVGRNDGTPGAGKSFRPVGRDDNRRTVAVLGAKQDNDRHGNDETQKDQPQRTLGLCIAAVGVKP